MGRYLIRRFQSDRIFGLRDRALIGRGGIGEYCIIVALEEFTFLPVSLSGCCLRESSMPDGQRV